MEYYFPDLIEAVNNCEATFPQGEWAYTYGSQSLARRIGKALLPEVKKLSVHSPDALKKEIEFLYSKAVKFSPFRTQYSIAQGIFYLQIEEFDKAVSSFHRAYSIHRDPTIKTYPHLQRTEENANLFGYLRYAIQNSTAANPRPPEP